MSAIVLSNDPILQYAKVETIYDGFYDDDHDDERSRGYRVFSLDDCVN